MSEAEGAGSRRTSPKTFRLPADLIRALERQAEDEGISVNSLVAKILVRDTTWESKGRKIGMVWISKPLLRLLLDAGDDEKIARLGRERMPDFWRNLATIIYGDPSLGNLMRTAKDVTRFTWVSAASFSRTGRTHRWNFNHDLGPRFSILLGSALDELLWTSIRVRPKLEMGDGFVSVSFASDSPELP